MLNIFVRCKTTAGFTEKDSLMDIIRLLFYSIKNKIQINHQAKGRGGGETNGKQYSIEIRLKSLKKNLDIEIAF